MAYHWVRLAVTCAVLQGCRDSAARPTPDEPALACASCIIQFTEVARVGSDNDTVGIQLFSKPLVHRNRILVAPAGNMSQIAVFGLDGTFQTSVGRRGEGPGEFGGIRDLIPLSAESLLVLDHRLTVVDPSLAAARTAQLPHDVRASRAAAGLNGRVFLNSYAISGPPFVQLNGDLREESRFGHRATDPDGQQYLLTPDSEGGLWAVRAYYTMTILHFDKSGGLVDSFAPQSTWFADWHPDAADSPNPWLVPPKPHATGVAVDSAGRLWITGIGADAHWADRPRSSRGSANDFPMPSLAEAAQLYDSFVEVVDPVTHSIIASRRHDGVLGGISGNLLWDFLESVGGGIVIRLISPSLARQPPGGSE